MILLELTRYVKTFKLKGGNKGKNNKLMFLQIHDDELLEKNKTIWTKMEGLLIIKVNALPVHDESHIKTKIKTYKVKFILILAF